MPGADLSDTIKTSILIIGGTRFFNIAGLTSVGRVQTRILSQVADADQLGLATGAGSGMFSHLNDPAFRMFKAYFNLSIKDIIKIWSLMETIVAVAGPVLILLHNYFIHS